MVLLVWAGCTHNFESLIRGQFVLLECECGYDSHGWHGVSALLPDSNWGLCISAAKLYIREKQIPTMPQWSDSLGLQMRAGHCQSTQKSHEHKKLPTESIHWLLSALTGSCSLR